jgi:hypothetical protein
MAFWHTQSIDSSENNYKFTVYEGSSVLSNLDFLQSLKESEPFGRWYSQFLTSTGFDAFFWENKPFTANTLSSPYECNIVRSTYLAGQSPDSKPFRDYFDDKKEVVSFSNLGKDAQLIAPVPKDVGDDFTHLGRFLCEADKNQIDRFWKTVAGETLQRISDKPLWLSTSGLGVFWLHARIDTYPKYYQTEEYKTP